MKYHIEIDKLTGCSQIYETKRTGAEELICTCYTEGEAIMVCQALNLVDKFGVIYFVPEHLQGRGG